MSDPEHGQDKRGLDAIPDLKEVAKEMEKLRAYRQHHLENTFCKTPDLWLAICQPKTPPPFGIDYTFDLKGINTGPFLEDLPEGIKTRLHKALLGNALVLINGIPNLRSSIFDSGSKIKDQSLFDIMLKFSTTEAGIILRDNFNKAENLGKTCHFKASLESPKFVTALHEITELTYRRITGEPKGEDKTYYQRASKPGYPTDVCSPDYLRQIRFNAILKALRNQSPPNFYIEILQILLEPFSEEEDRMLSTASESTGRSVRRANSGKSKPIPRTPDYLLHYWLPLALWKENHLRIAALIKGALVTDSDSGDNIKVSVGSVKRALGLAELSRATVWDN